MLNYFMNSDDTWNIQITVTIEIEDVRDSHEKLAKTMNTV